MQQLVLDVAPEVLPSIENFVPGPNLEVLSSLRAILARQRHERFLYLFGEAGSGKTHLLRAAAAANANARYLAAQSEQQLIAQDLAPSALVAIDDADRLGERAQIELMQVFNEARRRDSLLLVSASVAPGRLQLRADVATRLASMLAYQLKPLSDEDKALALRQRAVSRGMRVSDEVLDFLLNHWQRDLPSLMSALDRLDEFSLQTHRQITIPLLKQAIGVAN